MEQYGQAYGFIMYQTFVPGLANRSETVTLGIHQLRDRANIFVDGSVQRVMYRTAPMDEPINIAAGGSQLSILVENMGRINYGPYMFDPKVMYMIRFALCVLLMPLPHVRHHQ